MRPGNQLIQQFIILHLNLALVCTGKELGEGATEEELALEILYHYNRGDSDRSGREALRFAGLCTALYSLPSEMQAENEVTKEIYFEKCSLVFIPLEMQQILAVAQIGRRSAECHGATPEAVRRAIEETHLIFSMLRGGGIVCRLKERSHWRDSVYPGMERLFARLKTKRKIISSEEIADIDSELTELVPALAIYSLRNDLRAHYDAFVSETTLLASQHVGVFRNIVQRLPQPPESSAQLALQPIFGEQLQHKLLTVQQTFTAAKILGVSTFIRGHLVSSQIHNNEFVLSVDENIALFNYMSSFRAHLRNMHGSFMGSLSTGSRTPPKNGTNRKPFAPLALSLADFDDTPIQTHLVADQTGFLSPPPLALLSALDDDYSFDGPTEEGRVWMPPICLRTADAESHLDLRVALYESNDLSILLYVSNPERPVDDFDAKSFYRELLHCAQETIVKKYMQATLPETIQSSDVNSDSMLAVIDWTEPGQDLILVDRHSKSVSVYVNNAPMEHQEFAGDRPANPLNGLKKMFKTRGKTNAGRRERSMKSHGVHVCLEANGMDKRYLLAAHLSLDALLAIDDLIACIQEKLQADSSLPIELCTFLTQRWIYAYGDEDVEIYAVLDTNIFVTVGDVLNAIKKVRIKLLGDEVDKDSIVK